MAEFVLLDITDEDSEDEVVEALLVALEGKSKVAEFHGDHDQSAHGNWADDNISDTDKAALQKHLVDFKADRELEGADARPIAKVIPGAQRVGYLDVPNIEAMHRLMGVPTPSLETDPEEYASARDRLFKEQPLVQVPMSKLMFTQPRINEVRAAALAKLPEQLSKPVSVVKTNGKFYLMNGHHRVVAQHVAKMRNVAANVLDLDDRRFHRIGIQYREFHLEGEHDQSTHGSWAHGNGSTAIKAKSRDPNVLKSLARDIEVEMDFDKMADSIRDKLHAQDVQTRSLHVDKNGEYFDYRTLRHEEIIDGWLSRATPVENPTLTIIGGLSGAGKSSVKQSGEIDLSNTVPVDADDIRSQLPEYKGWNAAHTLKESDDIVAKILGRALRDRKNIVFDGTIKTQENVQPMIDLYKRNGYKVNIVFVDTPIDVAMRNAITRFKTTGRYVDSNFIAAQDHKNRETFDKIKSQADDWSLYENPTGRKAVLKERKRQ